MLDEFSKWDVNERKLWNKSSLILDLNQDGPNGKSYYDWVLGCELSIGAKNRGQCEIYFLKHLSSVMDNGPLTLQSQNLFLKSKVYRNLFSVNFLLFVNYIINKVNF